MKPAPVHLSRDERQSPKEVPHKFYGEVPTYIRRRQSQEHAKQMEVLALEEKMKVPHGTRLLPDLERR